MPLSAKDKALFFELLPQCTSLGVVSLFLKGLNLSYSAVSWGDMFEKRLEPAIANGDISRQQLHQLLSDSEEFGHQNVFLFRCSRATTSDLVNEDAVKRTLKRLDRDDLIDSPPIIRTSDALALAQVRFEMAHRGRRALVIKAVQTRTYLEKVEESRIARLHDDGLLEVRIQSFERAADYDVALSEIWSLLNPLLPQRKFELESMHKFKEYLIKNRTTLESRIRFAPLLARSATGYTMALGVPDQQKSLFKDKGAAEGFAAFSKYDSTVESGNFIWIKQTNARPARDIHIRIAGKVNQFAVVVTCERADYEHVFQEIRENHG